MLEGLDTVGYLSQTVDLQVEEERYLDVTDLTDDFLKQECNLYILIGFELSIEHCHLDWYCASNACKSLEGNCLTLQPLVKIFFFPVRKGAELLGGVSLRSLVLALLHLRDECGSIQGVVFVHEFVVESHFRLFVLSEVLADVDCGPFRSTECLLSLSCRVIPKHVDVLVVLGHVLTTC